VAEYNSPALTVAMAFYEAWNGKDLDRAMSYVRDDIVCEAPPGRIQGIEKYRAFWAPFLQIFHQGSCHRCLWRWQNSLADVRRSHDPGGECAHSRLLHDKERQDHRNRGPHSRPPERQQADAEL